MLTKCNVNKVETFYFLNARNLLHSWPTDISEYSIERSWLKEYVGRPQINPKPTQKVEIFKLFFHISRVFFVRKKINKEKKTLKTCFELKYYQFKGYYYLHLDLYEKLSQNLASKNLAAKAEIFLDDFS